LKAQENKRFVAVK